VGDVAPSAAWTAWIEQIHREEAAALTGLAFAMLRDLDAAEEAVQEAWSRAVVAWRSTRPDRPGAWLAVTVKRIALDRLRAKRRQPLDLDAVPLRAEPAAPLDEEVADVEDAELRLLFTCAHPALSPEAQTALMLRLVVGLDVRAIARAYLVPEATVAQRLVRAKRRLREEGSLEEPPTALERAARLPVVLEAIYLVFNEGYAASAGPELVRHDLLDAALRLARLLARLLPTEAEVGGLLALLELQASRVPARVDASGALVPLDAQDRSLWDRDFVDRGLGHLARAMALRRSGPYQVQAAIAALHAEAPSFEATDWPQVLALYTHLHTLTQSPVVALNRLVALSYVDGPGAALAGLEPLAREPSLAEHHRVDVVRADLLRRLGRVAEAVEAYRRAAAGAPERERAFLEARATDLERSARSSRPPSPPSPPSLPTWIPPGAS
jgi:RNA polymerase sigma-70 factor (ECF subfamily)